MSLEYTGANKETVRSDLNNFLDACPSDTQFKMIINSKRGHLKIKIIKIKHGRIRRLFGRLRRRKAKN